MAAAVDSAVIRAGEIYPLDEFKRRTRVGAWALRSARRKGLRVFYVAGRAFVAADDWLAFLVAQAGGQR